MKKEIKHVIYSNDYTARPDEDCIENILANNPDRKREEITDEEICNERAFLLDCDYECEKGNLDKPLDGRILIVADMGLWTGRHSGYKIVETRNLNEVLQAACRDSLSYEVYFDGHNVRANDGHHDGTNCYTFREIREDRNVDVLLSKIYDGTVTNADINRYTRSLGAYVKDIYGWGKLTKVEAARVAA